MLARLRLGDVARSRCLDGDARDQFTAALRDVTELRASGVGTSGRGGTITRGEMDEWEVQARRGLAENLPDGDVTGRAEQLVAASRVIAPARAGSAVRSRPYRERLRLLADATEHLSDDAPHTVADALTEAAELSASLARYTDHLNLILDAAVARMDVGRFRTATTDADRRPTSAEGWAAGMADLAAAGRAAEELARAQPDWLRCHRFASVCTWQRGAALTRRPAAGGGPDAAGAVALYDAAARQMAAVERRFPNRPDLTRALLICTRTAAGIENDKLDRTRAEEALGLAEQLPADLRRRPKLAAVVAECHTTMASVLMGSDMPAAVAHSVASAEAYRLVVDAWPDSPQSWLSLGWSARDASWFHAQVDDWAETFRYSLDAVGDFRSAVQATLRAAKATGPILARWQSASARPPDAGTGGGVVDYGPPTDDGADRVVDALRRTPRSIAGKQPDPLTPEQADKVATEAEEAQKHRVAAMSKAEQTAHELWHDICQIGYTRAKAARVMGRIDQASTILVDALRAVFEGRRELYGRGDLNTVLRLLPMAHGVANTPTDESTPPDTVARLSDLNALLKTVYATGDLTAPTDGQAAANSDGDGRAGPPPVPVWPHPPILPGLWVEIEPSPEGSTGVADPLRLPRRGQTARRAVRRAAPSAATPVLCRLRPDRGPGRHRRRPRRDGRRRRRAGRAAVRHARRQRLRLRRHRRAAPSTQRQGRAHVAHGGPGGRLPAACSWPTGRGPVAGCDWWTGRPRWPGPIRRPPATVGRVAAAVRPTRLYPGEAGKWSAIATVQDGRGVALAEVRGSDVGEAALVRVTPLAADLPVLSEFCVSGTWVVPAAQSARYDLSAASAAEDWATAAGHAIRLAQFYDRVLARHGIPVPPWDWASVHLAWARYAVRAGDLPQALAAVEQGLAIGDHFRRWRLQAVRGHLLLLLGRPDEAAEQYRALAAAAGESEGDRSAVAAVARATMRELVELGHDPPQFAEVRQLFPAPPTTAPPTTAAHGAVALNGSPA